jgi:putative membrane protein
MWIFLTAFALLTIYNVIVIRFNLFPLFNPLLTPLTTLLGFGFALLHASQRWNWRAALTLFIISFMVSLAYESFGVATGLVYGPYHYTEKLGPKFLGLVPYLIPAAWFMMMYPSLVIAERIAPHVDGWKRGLVIAALGGIVMTAWDVVMDPMMVRGGHWVWEVKGAYFGIPLQNYWGWWLTTFTVFLVNWLVMSRNSDPARAWAERSRSLKDDRLAVLSYILTGLSSILVCLDPDVVTELGGAGLAGLFAMSPWAIMGWIHANDRSESQPYG